MNGVNQDGGALALGGAGAAVSLWPELHGSATPKLMGLVAASFAVVAFAGVMALARVQPQRDSLWTIVFMQNLLPALALVGPAWALWQPLQLSALPIIGLIGGVGTIGLLAVTWAFQHIEASKAPPLEHTGLLWAGLPG